MQLPGAALLPGTMFQSVTKKVLTGPAASGFQCDRVACSCSTLVTMSVPHVSSLSGRTLWT